MSHVFTLGQGNLAHEMNLICGAGLENNSLGEKYQCKISIIHPVKMTYITCSYLETHVLNPRCPVLEIYLQFYCKSHGNIDPSCI